MYSRARSASKFGNHTHAIVVLVAYLLLKWCEASGVAGVLSVPATGSQPFEYQLLKDGNPILGAPGKETKLQAAALPDSTYRVVQAQNGTGQAKNLPSVNSELQPVTRLWSQFVQRVIAAPAIAADGVVYVTAFGHLNALNRDGTTRWIYGVGNVGISSAPVIGGEGTIYFGGGANLDAMRPDGTKRWEFNSGDIISGTPAIGADQTIYFGNFSNLLFALNPDGTLKWKLVTAGPITSSVAISEDGNLLFGSGTALTAVSPQGTKRWELATGGPITSSPAIDTDGTIYIGSQDGEIYAVTPQGEKKWTFATGGPIYSSSPVIDVDGTVYTGSDGFQPPDQPFPQGKILALNPDGSKKWEFPVGNTVHGTAAIAADGTIYIGTHGRLYALNRNGTEKWEVEMGAVESGVTLDRDGTIYVGDDNSVHAIKGESPPAKSPWPMFHREVRHRGRVSSGAPAQISVVSPAQGSNFLPGISVSVEMSMIETDEPVDKVELFLNGKSVGSNERSPYGQTLDSLPVGAYTLIGKATDAAGKESTSVPVNFAIVTPALTISTSSGNTSFLSGDTINLIADASGSSQPVVRVQFYRDDELLETDESSPFTAIWTNAMAGAHIFTARGTDGNGVVSTSPPLSVQVLQQPAIILTSPGEGTVYSIGEDVAVTADTSGSINPVKRVDFYAGTRLIGTVDSAPYRISWSSSVAGAYQLTGKLIDTAGVTNSSAPVNIWFFAPGTEAIDLTGFESAAGLILQDQATVSSNRLHLNALAPNGLGGAWLARKRFIADGFECVFDFQITNRTAGGGSGFAFVIQNNATPILGNGGSGMGYDGIPNSLAIEFDTFQDAANRDPVGNQIGFHTRQTSPNSADESYAYGVYVQNPVEGWDIADGKPHRVYVTYTGKDHTLSVKLEPFTGSVAAFYIDLNSDLELDNGQAWIGFTGSTATGYETHDLLEWSFTSPPAIPYLTTQPQSQTAVGGTSATMSVSATGADPLQYQWLFKGKEIAGATSPSLTLNSVQATNDGDYTVRVSNVLGSTISNPAHLTVTVYGTRRWTFEATATYSSPAIDDDGTIYYGVDGSANLGDRLIAVTPQGTRKWQLLFPYSIHNAPAIGQDHVIYVACADRNLYAVDPNGKIKWTFQASGSLYGSPALGADGTIYFGCEDFRLYAVLPNGTKKWDYLTEGNILSSPAIASDGTIYFGSLDHKVYALNPDGTKKWAVTTGNEVHGSPAIDENGNVLISSYDNNLYAITPSGTVKWKAGNAASDSGPAVGPDGTIYNTRGFTLSAFTPTGSLKWTFPTSDKIANSPAVAADGTIYFGSMNGKFYALNPNGSRRWDADAGASIGESSPAIGRDGTVYVGTYGGSLIAFNGSAPLADSAWPMFRRDLDRTGRAPAAGPPLITQQPQSITLGAGTNLVLVSTAIGGSPLSYQWFRNEQPLTEEGNITGTQTPQLTITGTRLDQGGRYFLRVSNAKGTKDSSVAAITVLPFYQPPGTKLWDFQAGAEIFNSPALAADKTIYFTPTDNKVYALSSGGSELWKFDAGARCGSPSIALDGTIYVGTDTPSDSVLALNPDGTKKWEYPVGFPVQTAPAIAFDGTILFTARDGRLHALKPDGSPLWDQSIGGGIYQSAPTIAEDGTIYVGAGVTDPTVGNVAGDFYGFYPGGTQKWHFRARGPFNSAALGKDGMVYFGTGDNEGILYAFDQLGHPQWNYRAGTAIFSSPVLDDQGSIYFAHYEGTTFALGSTGTKKWTTSGIGTAAIGSDGTIYLPTRDGHFRAVDQTGNERWSLQISTWGDGSAPILSSDGIIYLTWADKLVALQASSGPAKSTWPMYQHDARHTGNLQAGTVPAITLQQPTEGSRFHPGDNIPLGAAVLGGSGGIIGVDFYANDQVIGDSLTPPYSMVWQNAASGVYHLTAIVTDQAGVTGISEEVTITVNDAPSVELKLPLANASFLDEEDVLIAADAFDSDGTIVKVEFYEGNHLLATVTKPPFSYLWERVGPGAYQISALAYDDRGEVARARNVAIGVDARPEVTLTSPSDNSQFRPGQPIVLAANATDSDGTVARVEFYEGAQLLATIESPPFSYSINATEPGQHVYIAQAVDNLGARATSVPISATVAPENLPPVISFSAPFDHEIVRSPAIIQISARATDPDGQVTRTDLFANDQLLATFAGSNPALLGWTNPPPGDYVLKIQAVDNLGAVAVRSLELKIVGSDRSIPEPPLPSSSPRPDLWVPDGPVYSLLEHEGILYVGGAFQNIGQFTAGHAIVDISSPSPDLSYPSVDLLVDVIIGDGDGGYYVGGYFNSIGNINRRGIAHVNPDKSVDLNFSADANGHVLTLVLVGDTLYAGGEFDEIRGQKQRYIAALDAKTGALKPWNPEPTGWIGALAVTGTTVFMGGDFEYVGGKYRNRIAAVDSVSGLALPWKPEADKIVSQLMVAGQRLFAIGRFTQIAGETRNGLASFDIASGNLDSFNSSALGDARSMALEDGTVYIAGGFGVIALDLATGAVGQLNIHGDGPIDSIAVQNDLIYLAGEFTTINGATRNHVAAVNRLSGGLSSLDLNPSGRFVLVANTGDKVFGAGSLGLIKVPRQGLAAIDLATGFATGWNAPCDGPVYVLAASDDTLYVGGQFESLSGERRISLGAVDFHSGKATSWRPRTTPQSTKINAIQLQERTVLVAGYFNVIDDLARGNVAELDLRTGDATAWNPNADGVIHCLGLSGDTLYLGGEFTHLAKTPRNHIAAVNRFTGRVTTWNPGADGIVSTILPTQDVVYAGGGFHQLGGAARSYLGAVDSLTGQAISWTANTDGGVLALQKQDDILYVGGQFTKVGGVARINAAALNGRSAIPNSFSWDPRPDNGFGSSSVRAISLSRGSVYLGGDFKTVQGNPQPYLASFDLPTHFATPLHLPDGLFRLNFFGPLGYYYVFESSEDLKTWTPILTIRAPLLFEDAATLNSAHRFFRASPLK